MPTSARPTADIDWAGIGHAVSIVDSTARLSSVGYYGLAGVAPSDIIWRCWQDNRPYDPDQHGALQRILNQDQTGRGLDPRQLAASPQRDGPGSTP